MKTNSRDIMRNKQLDIEENERKRKKKVNVGKHEAQIDWISDGTKIEKEKKVETAPGRNTNSSNKMA